MSQFLLSSFASLPHLWHSAPGCPSLCSQAAGHRVPQGASGITLGGAQSRQGGPGPAFQCSPSFPPMRLQPAAPGLYPYHRCCPPHPLPTQSPGLLQAPAGYLEGGVRGSHELSEEGYRD